MKTLKEKYKKLLRTLLAFTLLFSSLNFTAFEINAATSLVAEAKASVSTIATNVTISGLKENANFYEITLGGSTAFCFNHGLGASSSNIYTQSDKITNTTIIQTLNWYSSCIDPDDYFYAFAQAYIWCALDGITDEETIRAVVSDILDIWYPDLDLSVGFFYGTFVSSINLQSTSGTYYYWSCGSSSQQRLVPISTPTSTVPLIEDGTATATATYDAVEEVQLIINKTDSTTSNTLSGVEFEIYQDGDYITTVTTNSSGYASYKITMDYTASASVSESYVTNYSSLSVENQSIVSSMYDYFSYATAYASALKQAEAKAEEDALANGSGESHVYEIIEVNTKTGYVLDSTTNTYTRTGSTTINLNMTNVAQTGSITLSKTDAETGNAVSNAIFTIYAKSDIVHPDGTTGTLYSAGDVVAVMPATDSSGQTTVSGLYLGEYYVVETTAPNGYVIEDTVYNCTLVYAGQDYEFATTSTASATNTAQRVEITLNKVDAGMDSYSSGASDNPDIVDFDNNGSQGDATIEGATYGLYASSTLTYSDVTNATVTYNSTSGSDNEITLLDGTDLVVYNTSATSGTLLATAKTDENGVITFGNLYNGEYYIKEITASEGYLLDTTTYSINASYSSNNATLYTVEYDTTVYETVQKQAFEIAKYGTSTVGGTSVLTPLEGVTFEVQLESDIQSFINDGYTLDQAKELAPVYDTLVTDYLGADTSIELPYGTYRITETKTIGEYEFATDFFITIDKDSRTPLEHELYATVINYEFTAMIQVVKEDAESGKQVAIAGAEYMIKDTSTGLYIGYWDLISYPTTYVTTFTTNEEGYLYVPEKFAVGTYELIEVTAPYGYTLDSTPIEFDISSNGVVSLAPDGVTKVITVTQTNDAVKGQIEIYKEGESLVDYTDGDFVYEVLPLANASYEIYAKSDIMDPSNDGTVLYEKDELIETITTGEDGYALSSELYLGEYYVVEVTAPEGYTVSDIIEEVTLSYEDQYTAIVYESVSYTNERQTVDMQVYKQDEETQVLISGAEFTLYANKDIYNYYGDIIVEAGTELQTIVSDENGSVSFTLDLPIDLSEVVDTSDNETVDENGYTLIGDQDSLFYLIETKAPTGYQPKDVIYFVGTRSIDQITIEYTPTTTFGNKITKVYFDKVDANEEYLSGSLLQVIEVVEGEEVIIDEWTSSDKTYVIEGLEINHTYYLREVSATTGYTIATDIEFTVDAYNNEKLITMINGSVEVAKYDTTTETLLAGATFEVYQVSVDGEILVDSFTTDGENTYFINNLVVGNQYIIREVDTPLGFVTMEDMRFTVVANEDMYIELGNTTYVDIYKVDADTQEQIEGATLEIFTYDVEGNEVIIDTFISGTEYYHVVGLVNGETYYLRELASPEGYYYSDEVMEFTIGSDVNVAFENEVVTTEFIKIDSYSEGKVTGAELEVFEILEDGSENSIETFITSEQNHIITGLIEGNTYYLREVEAPEGYYFTEEVVEFIAGTDTFVTLENAPILTSIVVNKVDSQTGNAIISSDFEFTMYADADCTEVLQVVNANTEDGTATFENIYYGTYYIKETSAPLGYKLSDEVKVVVIDDLLEGVGDVYSFDYQNTLLPIVITGDTSTSIALYSALLLITSIFLLVYRKNQRKEG